LLGIEQGGKVKKRIKLSVVILGGLVLAVLSFVGCYPTSATTTPGQAAGGITSYLPIIIILVLIFAMFYFLMVRPMRQREKKHDEMVSELRVGDRVITASGIYGVIDSVGEESVLLKVESGATMRVTKGSILGRTEADRF
jgi:preprotein translocase subunit YajC